jgi:hypothetical protein
MKEIFLKGLKTYFKKNIEKNFFEVDDHGKKVNVKNSLRFLHKHANIFECVIFAIEILIFLVIITLLSIYMSGNTVVIFLCGFVFYHIIVTLSNGYAEIINEIELYIILSYGTDSDLDSKI